MAKKYDLITELYAEGIKEVTATEEQWLHFLNSACRNFRLPFDEQLLVYLQRPEASSVLGMEDWNRKFGRWVKHDSKAIAVFDKSGSSAKLKYYFDVTDTSEGKYKRLVRPVPLWEITEENREAVQETLRNAFRVSEDVTEFAEVILQAAQHAAEDNLLDYMPDILAYRQDSFLEELDAYSVEVETRTLLSNSIAYMLMVRCGIDSALYLEKEDFRNIRDFHTPELVNLFGTATSDVAEMALAEISDTIRKLQQEQKRNDRTFAQTENVFYTEEKGRKTANMERSFAHEKRDIQQAGRLPVTESDRTGRNGSTHWEIWLPSSELSERTPLRNLSESSDARETEPAFERDTGNSTEQDGTAGNRDDESTERDGRDESQRSDEMGRNGEQHPTVSGRDREDRTDQPLAWYDRSKEDKSLPFFHRDQDIKELLLATPYLKVGKAEIRAFFEREEDRETRRDYIKSIFNNESTELTLQDGRTVGYKTYQNVLHLWKGSASSRTAKSYYDWNVIADYFEGMRLLEELRDQKEPLRTVNGQFEFLQDLAEEKTSAFSFSQEMVDYVLRSGSGIQHGKFRIYSYFLQGHSRREQEEFLKEEYGMGGRSPILSGTGISEEHSAKGLKLSRGYQEGAPQLLLKWSQVAKRIEELIAADRYMTAKELEYLPEYEKHILTREIYHFYSEQPEEVIRPYARGAGYEEAIQQIRPQLEKKKRVEQLAEEMSAILENTADFDRKYTSMQKTYRDVCEFRDGIFSLFTPIPAEKEMVPLPISETHPSPEHIEEETEKAKENTEDLALDQEEVYELQTDTLVYIGVDEYDILSISEDVVRLRNQKYPIFTEEMTREEFERKLRENPANDFLKKGKEPEEIPLQEPDLPAEKETAQDLSPAWEKATPRRTDSFDLHPEIPQSQRLQFQITDDALGKGTAREKFRANVKAIQVLKQCEAQNRYATREEQQVLSGYVGWGGLADAFDASVSAWNQEYVELQRILTEEEYRAARESTMTAFYTPPVVIRSIYQALENMGLRSGNILEPSCGIGNFIGMKPEHLSDCNIYGVEIDSISGRIARQLYQKSAIAVQGYEETNLPDSFFDVVVGNVPFANYKVLDKRYDSLNFLIHDYFIAKSIDKTRPGGVLALITSNGISGGTMDKRDNRVRKYIAERCDLLGAIRLPNNTFLENAGTIVNTDILFLQKKENPRSTEPPAWVDVNVLQRNDFTNEKGETKHRTVCINPYFQEHPEMVLGKLEIVSGAYGPQLVCKPFEDADLGELLSEAIQNISAQITEYEVEELVETEDHSIPVEPDVANFSYALRDGKIYYRENSRMRPVELSLTGENRVKGMIAIRDCVWELIAYQMEEYSDEVIAEQQRKLNRLYDQFQSRYGLLNSRANSLVFSEDNSYPLLCSLEIVAEDGTLERKADMFTKRTIKPHQTVTRVDTASEALSLSLSEHARVDMEYMCTLTGKRAEEIEKELEGVIFRLPDLPGKEPTFVSEDEYLSGNVREKLKEAMLAAENSELYRPNVEALKRVQPKDLSASEINVRLGATWIPPEDIKDFMFELLQTPNYCQWKMNVRSVPVTGEWYVEGKSIDKGNVRANSTYGTHRVNAYRILEDTLNLRDVRVYDYVEDEEGRKKPILNKKETAIAQGKQDLIKQEFLNWIWKEPERRQRLTAYYNEKFNAIRPREYDGSHLNFYGMNPEIQLRQHQKNGVARIIYGGNTLLAYVVGAGKTYTMVAAAMECKRLGLCNKSMIVVPNHIIDQFAAEWLQLYPSANLLVATKKDFETKNRKKFCARIATSEIDAVIIGHSQFERIPLSVERQCRMLQEQIQETVQGIQEAGRERGNRITVKRLEKMKKTLEARLKRLNDQSKKDDVVCFEELGIDRLFVDEADSYKNLYLYTKMRNVGGIAQTEAQKSSDMFMKTRYMDEVTGGRGVIFATGTPISNSMVELYTMQRYLQYNTLVEHNLQFFDAWASTFGETVTAIELAPEGTGYRLKTRFAKFYNLPELMMMFREVADIQTADMLNLPVPEAEYRVISVKPSDMQKEMVTELGERAERVRNGMVNPTEDNMLLITNEGRKLALDQRLVNEMLPDDEGSKVNACVDEVYRFWYDTKEDKLTQLLFCDLSTPKKDGSFSVYNDVRDKLVSKGVPEKEIQFIHDANTEVRKKELFAKVRKGDVRILMGSTFKMGAGTNVQDLIIASHDLDCPWRPRDLEQRAGRTVRQGNKNKKVDIIRYVTEGTFDAYLYQVIENKQKIISQIMTSKNPVRAVEDVDATALSYAEIKALAAGNPFIKEKMDLDIQVSKLQLLKQSYLSQKYEMEDKVMTYFPQQIKQQEKWIAEYKEDLEQVKEYIPKDRETFPPMQIQGTVYADKKEAGQALIAACKAMKSPEPVVLGAYRGFGMELSYNTFSKEFVVELKGKRSYLVALGTDIYGNITRIDNEIEKIPDRLLHCQERLETLKEQLETAKLEVQKPFAQEEELQQKTARLGGLNAMLDMDKKEHPILDVEPDESVEVVETKCKVLER